MYSILDITANKSEANDVAIYFQITWQPSQPWFHSGRPGQELSQGLLPEKCLDPKSCNSGINAYCFLSKMIEDLPVEIWWWSMDSACVCLGVCHENWSLFACTYYPHFLYTPPWYRRILTFNMYTPLTSTLDRMCRSVCQSTPKCTCLNCTLACRSSLRLSSYKLSIHPRQRA